MNGWILAYLFIQALDLGYAIAKDDTYVRIKIWPVIIAKVLILWILYMGGVFS